jgi:hypothetical protein
MGGGMVGWLVGWLVSWMDGCIHKKKNYFFQAIKIEIV